MTLIKVDAGRIHEAFWEKARFPISYEMAQQLGLGKPTEFGGRGFLRGVRVNDISPLPPMSAFRAVVQQFAKQFVSDYARRGFDLKTPEDEMTVWGPYRPRDWDGLANESEIRAVGYSDPVAYARQLGKVDFLLYAEFIRHTGYVWEPGWQESNAAELAVALVGEREGWK